MDIMPKVITGWNDNSLTVSERDGGKVLLVAIHKKGDDQDSGQTVKISRVEFQRISAAIDAATT